MGVMACMNPREKATAISGEKLLRRIMKDNKIELYATYVVDMESEVLNYLNFQLSVPTTKTFLRRYIQAAQASCKVPCVELELLANYLAELTIVEYGFLNFLPSIIAASAVFLARWTLDQSEYPWNISFWCFQSLFVTSLLRRARV